MIDTNRRLAATLYGYSFLDDFVLLYPVYALLFSDTGLSVWQISSLFAIWSATSLILEVPSGAWADAVSRKLLLVTGPLLTAAGFALWVSAPSYWAFAVGFMLWGAKGALMSGALEALVYEELERNGGADQYAKIMGRAKAAGTIGVVLAMAAAGLVLDVGGYPAVGAASVAACVLTAAVAALFPEHRDRTTSEDDEPGLVDTLRAGVTEARRSGPVRVAIALVIIVSAVWGSLDEYTPLLIGATGVPEATVPLLLLVIWAGVALGGLVTGRAANLPKPGLALLLVGAGGAMAAGALTGRPAGIVLVAVAFAGFQLADVLIGARLQASVTGPARATVTSLAGMGTDLATLGVFGSYAALAGATGHGGAFAILAVPYAGVALWLLTGDRRVTRRVLLESRR
jgi:MFS family permease